LAPQRTDAGSQSYSKSELLALLAITSSGKASVILTRQLIAARLSIAHGSDPAPISAVLANADALLSAFPGKLPYPVKPSSAIGQAMTADAVVLDEYANGLLTPSAGGNASGSSLTLPPEWARPRAQRSTRARRMASAATLKKWQNTLTTSWSSMKPPDYSREERLSMIRT
jgi:hypothetical protein